MGETTGQLPSPCHLHASEVVAAVTEQLFPPFTVAKGE